MVYTITFNPSLDYIVTVDDFRLGITNRASSEMILPGGKGINVSAVLNSLGIDNTAIYFSAGFVGDEITRRIGEMGIRADEIRAEGGCSRINLKLRSIDGTEINGRGPEISGGDLEILFAKLSELKQGDVLVLAGSIPADAPLTLYGDIMHRLEGRGVRCVVDATGELLMNTLKYHPFLIKPNNHELGEVFGDEIRTRESAVPYSEMLLDMGAENVIVSMAGEGAVFASSDGNVILLSAPEGEPVNSVGAGDSMVAGFIAGVLTGRSKEESFKLAVASGSASTFSELLATKEEILKVYERI